MEAISEFGRGVVARRRKTNRVGWVAACYKQGTPSGVTRANCWFLFQSNSEGSAVGENSIILRAIGQNFRSDFPNHIRGPFTDRMVGMLLCGNQIR
jgi:hypothetical protein